jgi:hypothetical protein
MRTRSLMRRLIVATMLFATGTLMMLTSISFADDNGALAFLQELYKHYETSPDGVDIRSQAKAARYFTPTVAHLIDVDSAEAAKQKQVGRLDFDPFIGGQFWQPMKIALTVDAGSTADHALGTARYTPKDEKTPVVIKLDLVKTPAGWRISDMRWEGQPDSLVKILTTKQ